MDGHLPAANAFRFYNDDGGEAASSPIADQDTNVTVNVTSGDVIVHLRYRVDETGDTSGGATDDWGLDYLVNGTGEWTSVTAATSRVQAAGTGAQLTDGAATTNRATNGISDPVGLTFEAGEQEEVNGVIEDLRLQTGRFQEDVWALKVISANNADTDTLDFRVTYNGGAPGMANNVTPRITIQKTGGGVTKGDAFLLQMGVGR